MKAAKEKKPVAVYDLNSPEAVEEFRVAARELTKRETVSREAARAALVKMGIHTKTGRLTKNYR